MYRSRELLNRTRFALYHRVSLRLYAYGPRETHRDHGQDDQSRGEHGQRQVTDDGGVGLGAAGRVRPGGRAEAHRRQVVQLVLDGRAALLRGRQVVTLPRVRVAAAAAVVRPLSAARHALRVLPVQVQRERARGTAGRARAGARAARRVARLAELRGRVVVLGPGALRAQAVLEHEVRRARRALQRAFACRTRKRR